MENDEGKNIAKILKQKDYGTYMCCINCGARHTLRKLKPTGYVCKKCFDEALRRM
jgi:hypothetical protein